MGDKKKERSFKDENFFTTFGWMSNPDGMNLKGVELDLYAIIYGFSQTSGQYFTGSLQYLIECTNSSRRAVIDNLNSLVDKGFVTKEEISYNSFRYKAVVQKLHHGEDGAEIAPDGAEIAPHMVQKLHHDGADSAPNNIEIYKRDISINKREGRTTPIKHKYGEYKNVLLKDKELQTLIAMYGQEKTNKCIKELDEYIEMKGYKAQSHYLAIRKWVSDRVDELERKNKSQSSGAKKNQFNNFSQRDTDLSDLEQKLLSKGGAG